MWVHIGLVLAYVEPHGRAVVAQEMHFYARAQSRWACWVHIGLVLAYVGPHGRAVVGQEGCVSRHRAYVGLHGRAVVGQEGCISRHRAWSRWACWVHIGLVLAYVEPHGPKRVAFLGTAPGPGGHVGCIFCLSWLTLGHMGGPSWAKRVAFLGIAPTLDYMGGPSWPKRVAGQNIAPVFTETGPY